MSYVYWMRDPGTKILKCEIDKTLDDSDNILREEVAKEQSCKLVDGNHSENLEKKWASSRTFVLLQTRPLCVGLPTA